MEESRTFIKWHKQWVVIELHLNTNLIKRISRSVIYLRFSIASYEINLHFYYTAWRGQLFIVHIYTNRLREYWKLINSLVASLSARAHGIAKVREINNGKQQQIKTGTFCQLAKNHISKPVLLPVISMARLLFFAIFRTDAVKMHFGTTPQFCLCNQLTRDQFNENTF